MTRKGTNMKKLFITAGIMLGTLGLSAAATLYVDVQNGNDDNPGSSEMPLKTIEKAANIVNTLNEPGATIKIAPGLYTLENECLISSKQQYSDENPLIIEASIMPDDPNWTPRDMPIIVSALNPPAGENIKYIEASGLKVEMSHVVIRGLKFIGTPIPKVMYYPIYRGGKDLDDLVVSQCMFLNDQHVSTSNVAVIANGHGLKIDHCVFYNCSNAAVYWNAQDGVSKNNSMTYCIIDGGYVSGVWFCQTDEDFEFHHNIITHCQYAFMRDEKNQKTYKVNDCIINNNDFLSGKCNPNFELSETELETPYLEKNVIDTGEIELVKGAGLDMEIPVRFLQVEKGTLGSDLGAGLFKK